MEVEVRLESASEMEEQGGRADRTECHFFLLFFLFFLCLAVWGGDKGVPL